jgi:hypothetical protein
MANRLVPTVVLVIALSGCAATYRPPAVPNQVASLEFSGPAANAMKAARRALVSAGYEITSADNESGTISTAPRNLHVTPREANCGTTMGLDYLKDNRTSTKVSFGVIVNDHQLTVRATVQGEYKPGEVDQDITLTCVSTGALEGDMLAQIKQDLK